MDTGDFDQLSALSLRLIDYYHEMLTVHTDDPVLGACVICRTPRCQDWRSACTRLASAGEPLDRVVERPSDLVDSTADGQR